MSNARTKAERSKAKDARQMPVEDPGKHPSKRKRDKPFVVQCRTKPGSRWAYLFKIGWRAWGRYHSLEVAQTALEQADRKHGSLYEFRMGEG